MVGHISVFGGSLRWRSVRCRRGICLACICTVLFGGVISTVAARTIAPTSQYRYLDFPPLWYLRSDNPMRASAIYRGLDMTNKRLFSRPALFHPRDRTFGLLTDGALYLLLLAFISSTSPRCRARYWSTDPTKGDSY